MTYTIENNKLVSTEGNVEYHPTIKKSGTMKPSYLVIHYTAGASFEADVKTLSSSATQASCQLVLSKDGKWAQVGNLNDVLWHAGKSSWKGINGLNSHSIGIEVTCEGIVDYVRTEGDVRIYRTWFGKELRNDTTPIIDAAHPNGGPVKGWVLFTPKQLEELLEVGVLLMAKYGLKEAIGHDMIAPGRKSDPGPSMPNNIYSALNGRRVEVEEEEEAVARTLTVKNAGKSGLNMRAWPDPKSTVLQVLKEGTIVEYVRSKEEWHLVTANGTQGWCHSNYLK